MDLNEHFGFPKREGYGGVVNGVYLFNERDAGELLSAVEEGLRRGVRGPHLEEWRIDLMNMRWRAFVEDWSGWA